MIPTVLHHAKLQPLVRGLLLSTSGSTSIKQIYFNVLILKSIPQLVHFRRDGTRSVCLLQLSICLGQSKQILKVNTYSITCSRISVQLLGESLRLVKHI